MKTTRKKSYDDKIYIIILVQLIFVKKNISCYYIPQNVLSLAKALNLERSKS